MQVDPIAISDPAAPSPARPGVLERLRRFHFGHDVFISYARADAVEYAVALADALRRQGLDAYVDQLGTPPGPRLSPPLLRRLRHSSMMVLIASPAAARSTAVQQEVEEFVRHNQRLVVVDVDGALDEVEWYRDRILGGTSRRITAAELAAAEPSAEVVRRIVTNVDFARREDRARRGLRNVGLTMALLIVAGVGVSGFFGMRARFAAEAARSAGVRGDSAVKDAQAAREISRASLIGAAEAVEKRDSAFEAAGVANANRVAAQAAATRATQAAHVAEDTVAARRRLGKALQQASEAAASIDETGPGLARGLLQAMESLETEPTVEGLAAWMRAATLLPPRLHLLPAHAGEVAALAISADGSRLASGGRDGVVRVWNVTATRDGLTPARISAAPVDVRLSGGRVSTLAFSPDGRWLAAGSEGHRAWVWRLSNGERIPLPLPGASRAQVRQVAFSPDGRWLAVAGGDSAAWLVDTRGWTATRVGEGNAAVSAVAFSRDGAWLAVGGESLDVWRVEGRVRVAREALPRAAIGLAFSRDGSRLAVGTGAGIQLRRVERDGDGTPRLAAIPGGVEWRAQPGREARMALAFSRDGRFLASARPTDAIAQLWAVGSGREVSRIVDAAGGLALGAGWMAAGLRDGTVGFWRADAGKEVRRITHPDDVTAAAFSPDGKWLATGSDDRTVRVFEGGTFRPVTSFPHAGTVRLLAFSPGGRWLVAAGNGPVQVVETGSWRQARALSSPGRADSVAFSPDGRLLAVWHRRACGRGSRPELRVWNVDAGTEVAAEPAGCEPRRDARISSPRPAPLLQEAGTWARTTTGESWSSPDGAWKTTTPDSLAVLTDGRTGQEVARLAHGGLVRAVAISPDGHWLATASRDRTLRLWRLGGASELVEEGCARLPLHYQPPATPAERTPPRNPCEDRSAPAPGR